MSLIIQETAALTERGSQIREMLLKAGQVVDLEPETSALVASGLRVQALLDKVAADVELAADLVIDSADMLREAEAIAGRLAAVAGDSGEIERERKTLTTPMTAIAKLVNAGYNAPRDYIKRTGLDPLKDKILAYHQEQQRLQQEAEAAERRRREEEAAEAAAREAQARSEAENLAAEAAKAQAGGSEIVAQALAQSAAQSADIARSEAHQAVVALHTRQVVAPAAQAKGVRGTWVAVLTNIDALILHAAELLQKGDRSAACLLEFNEKAASALAKAQKQHMSVPGVKPEFKQSVAIRKGTV